MAISLPRRSALAKTGEISGEIFFGIQSCGQWPPNLKGNENAKDKRLG